MKLAQINIGRLTHPRGDPRSAEFFANLDRINAMAERLPGFVWRLKDDSGNATDIPFDGEGMIANLTVWDDVESLQRFVFQTAHASLYRKRAEWFDRLNGPHFAMWWIEDGHRPTYAEAAAMLARLEREGPGDAVFGWAQTNAAQQWREQRCG